MKKDEVKIGGVYQMKVSNHLAPVRVDKVSQYGGWDGTNLHSNRSVRIRTAQKLRLEYEPNPMEGAATKWLIKRPKHERVAKAAEKIINMGRAATFMDAASTDPFPAKFAADKGLTLEELREGVRALLEQGRMECP